MAEDKTYYTPQKGKTNNKWNKANYERLNLFVPEGMNAAIKEQADRQGMSKRAYCINAIQSAIDRDKAKD